MQNQFWGQNVKISTKWTVSQEVYGVKISNLDHTYFNINVTGLSKENQLL